MKRLLEILCILLFCTNICTAQRPVVPQSPSEPYDKYWFSEDGRFSAVNEQGLLLWYCTITDSTAMIAGSKSNMETEADKTNYDYITADTIIVPATVMHDGKTYKVVQMHPYGVFNYISSLTTVYLPATIELIGDSMIYSEYFADNKDNFGWTQDVDCNFVFTGNPNLQNIYVDADNPYYTSIDGVVYTKDLKNLVVYPQGRTADTYAPLSGCEHILRYAMYGSSYIKHLDLPNSLKSIGNYAGYYTQIESIVIKDSVQAIGFMNFGNRIKRVRHLTIGKQLSILGTAGLPKSDTIVCLAPDPPVGIKDYYSPVDSATILLVPRKSVGEYQRAVGWNNTKSIFPIEPPVVATDEGVTISWVQSFSATGYVWHMYQDEEHTQLVMSLEFDKDGRLANMTLGPAFGSNPQHAPARLADDGGEEEETQRFAEYYSFTIKNLSSNTDYYYTRQTLAEDEVIDEESGVFNTNPDNTPTRVDNAGAPSERGSIRLLEDGTFVIEHNGKRYLLNGTEVR